MRTVLIRISVVTNDVEFTIHHILNTNCKNINFAAEWFASHFYGFGKRIGFDSKWFFHYESICLEVTKVQEIDSDAANMLNELLYY